jgi:hypothetical protein
VVELRLMTLELCQVPEIEIAGALEVIIFEYDDTTTLITDSDVIASGVKANFGQSILLLDPGEVSITQAGHIAPLDNNILSASGRVYTTNLAATVFV